MIKRNAINPLVLLVILLTLASCTQTAPVAEGASVTVTIEGLDGVLIASGQLPLTEGVTAFDAFETLCEQTGVEYMADGSGSSAYITYVGGLAAGDEGDMSGWLFKVGGQMADVGAGAYTPQDGDVLLFYFTRDFIAEFE